MVEFFLFDSFTEICLKFGDAGCPPLGKEFTASRTLHKFAILQHAPNSFQRLLRKAFDEFRLPPTDLEVAFLEQRPNLRNCAGPLECGIQLRPAEAGAADQVAFL